MTKPATSVSTIIYVSSRSEDLTLAVRDIMGQPLLRKKVRANIGYNQFTFDEVEEFKPGIYMLDFVTNGVVIHSQKIIKQ